MKGGVLPWLVRWACGSGTRDFCSALAALLAQYKIYFCPHCKLFQFLFPQIPNAQQAGQAAVLSCLSLIVCLWV
jgi:hypothetical protein